MSAPSPPFIRNGKYRKGYGRADNAYQDGGNPGNRLTAVARVRAEMDAAPIVRNQSRWSVRGGYPSRYELRG